ncbi:MAG: fructosamine kinase family protein [Candidatus Dactylopiibacterium sp.]|nr:fructosamine kinase family protein [Candidatus Dactylopiibacterium sp.]
MLAPALHSALQAAAGAALGADFRIESAAPVAGGDIHHALRLTGGGTRVFVKWHADAASADLFAAEADGLRALARCDAFRVPAVLAQGSTADAAFLMLEWLDLAPIRADTPARRAGEALAALHRCTGERFGWPRDNFIGATPQANAPGDNWSRFFVRQRLAPQLERAAQRGFRGDLQKHGERVCDKAPALFLDYRPAPSLLHGDLWSGNLAALPDGTPALFDPAACFGDREADLAMTELFGGLPLAFYAAYREAWPPDEGYEVRKTLYNLYHVLNHLNLFGGGYLRQAERMAAALAAELGR